MNIEELVAAIATLVTELNRVFDELFDKESQENQALLLPLKGALLDLTKQLTTLAKMGDITAENSAAVKKQIQKVVAALRPINDVLKSLSNEPKMAPFLDAFRRNFKAAALAIQSEAMESLGKITPVPVIVPKEAATDSPSSTSTSSVSSSLSSTSSVAPVEDEVSLTLMNTKEFKEKVLPSMTHARTLLSRRAGEYDGDSIKGSLRGFGEALSALITEVEEFGELGEITALNSSGAREKLQLIDQKLQKLGSELRVLVSKESQLAPLTNFLDALLKQIELDTQVMREGALNTISQVEIAEQIKIKREEVAASRDSTSSSLTETVLDPEVSNRSAAPVAESASPTFWEQHKRKVIGAAIVGGVVLGVGVFALALPLAAPVAAAIVGGGAAAGVVTATTVAVAAAIAVVAEVAVAAVGAFAGLAAYGLRRLFSDTPEVPPVQPAVRTAVAAASPAPTVAGVNATEGAAPVVNLEDVRGKGLSGAPTSSGQPPSSPSANKVTGSAPSFPRPSLGQGYEGGRAKNRVEEAAAAAAEQTELDHSAPIDIKAGGPDRR